MKFIKQSWVNFNRFMDNQSEWFCLMFIICMNIATAILLSAAIFYLGIKSLIIFPFIFVALTYIRAQFKQKVSKNGTG